MESAYYPLKIWREHTHQTLFQHLTVAAFLPASHQALSIARSPALLYLQPPPLNLRFVMLALLGIRKGWLIHAPRMHQLYLLCKCLELKVSFCKKLGGSLKRHAISQHRDPGASRQDWGSDDRVRMHIDGHQRGKLRKTGDKTHLHQKLIQPET